MPAWPQFESLVSALGWTLIHFLWQGLGIAGLYWVVSRLAGGKSALIRYWAGMAGLGLSVIFPAITFYLYYNPGSAMTLAVSGSAVVLTPSYALNPSLTQFLSAGMEPALPYVVVLWAIGVSWLSFRATLGWFGARRLVGMATHPVSAALIGRVRALEAHLGLSRAVTILQSTKVDVPTVIGWLKPVILLPVSVVTRLPADQLEMVIAHELGHVHRLDYLFNLVQIVIETLFFYHPAIRWMSGQIRQEREHCCDDLVVTRCNSPLVYARALANIESLRGPRNMVAMAATGGDLVHRVRRIVQRELPRSGGGFAHITMMFSVAALVSLSAHQGLEMHKHISEASSPEASQGFERIVLDDLDRSEWARGVSVYSGLGRIKQALALQKQEKVRQQEEQLAVLARAEAERQARRDRQPEIIASRQVQKQAPDIDLALPVHDQIAMKMLAGVNFNQGPVSLAEEQERARSETYQVKPGSMVAPVYPFKARRKRIEGHVRLEFSIDETGRPTDIEVVDASPPQLFENSAVKALEKWAFDIDQDHSEETRVYQVFDFAMEDTNPVVPKRERRCDITGSRICGLKRY